MGNRTIHTCARAKVSTGHSSGGWATLQLQNQLATSLRRHLVHVTGSLRFAGLFGTNIYAANANAYRNPDGSPRPLVRVDGNVMATAQHHLRKGRIHLIAETADTFYLAGAVQLLEKQLQELGAQAHVTYMPGRTHFGLFTVETDELGPSDEIAKEMYVVTGPSSPE